MTEQDDDQRKTLALLRMAIELTMRQGGTIQRLLWLNYASLAMVVAALAAAFAAIWRLPR